MQKEFKVYLFRHGQTTFNRDRKFTGWLDPGLTKLGRQQARTIAKKLKSKKFKIAIQTKLRRSKQTLKEVLKFHPECTKILEDNRMIERNYGRLNGKSHKEFIKRIGKKLANFEIEGDLLEDLDDKARTEAEQFLGIQEFNLIHRGFFIPPPKGESFAMVEARVRQFIKDLKKLIKKEKTNIAVSAHGNSIRLFRKIMENAPVQETISWTIPYDDYYEYTIKV